MITPQQIEQISFSKAKFGGYDMAQVDEILEPLTEDYVSLYKENALLKSKMRVLVGKLEDYRKADAARKAEPAPAAAEGDAEAVIAEAKKTAEQMVADAKAKCDEMIKKAQEEAAAITAAAAPAAEAAPAASANTDALVAVEKARVAEARKAAAARITEIQLQMKSCIQALDRIKNANVTPAARPAAATAAPAPVAPAAKPAVPAADVYDSDAVADEISQNLEALVGTTQDTAPKAPPAHPSHESTTSRFTNLNLQFGRNYDPTHK